MSKTLNRILGTSNKLPEETEDYKPLVMTGGRPCMGFSIIQADGNMSAFLYHSLDNLVTHPSIDGQELLAFTHRGTAVTIRGKNLRKVLRAIMSHTLQEIGAERMQGLQALALVMAAPGGLSVNGDDVMPIWPEGLDPALEAGAEQLRVDPVDQGAQPAGARHSLEEGSKLPKKREVIFAPGDDIIEIVARRYRPAGQ